MKKFFILPLIAIASSSCAMQESPDAVPRSANGMRRHSCAEISGGKVIASGPEHVTVLLSWLFVRCISPLVKNIFFAMVYELILS